jgi:hypothetical protein
MPEEEFQTEILSQETNDSGDLSLFLDGKGLTATNDEIKRARTEPSLDVKDVLPHRDPATGEVVSVQYVVGSWNGVDKDAVARPLTKGDAITLIFEE